MVGRRAYKYRASSGVELRCRGTVGVDTGSERLRQAPSGPGECRQAAETGTWGHVVGKDQPKTALITVQILRVPPRFLVLIAYQPLVGAWHRPECWQPCFPHPIFSPLFGSGQPLAP